MNLKHTTLCFFTFIALNTYLIESYAQEASCDLCQAVESNDIDSATTIVKNKDKLNELNEKGIWPLFLALKNRNEKMVRLLLEAGVNVNYTDTNGISALNGTVLADRPRMTQLLIEAGANPNLKSKDGNSAIHLAAITGKSRVLTELLKGEFNIDLQNANGETPLSSATQADNTADIISILLKAGANPNRFDNEKLAPIHYVAMSNDMELLDLLIEYGADVNAQAGSGLTPVIASTTSQDNEEMIRALVDKEAKLETIGELDGQAMTALMMASMHTSSKNLKTLLKMGADPNTIAGGLTALALAVLTDNIRAVELLISHEANPEFKFDGQSLIELAENKPEILSLLTR